MVEPLPWGICDVLSVILLLPVYIMLHVHIDCCLFGGCGKGPRGKEPYELRFAHPLLYLLFRYLPELGGVTLEVVWIALLAFVSFGCALIAPAWVEVEVLYPAYGITLLDFVLFSC